MRPAWPLKDTCTRTKSPLFKTGQTEAVLVDPEGEWESHCPPSSPETQLINHRSQIGHYDNHWPKVLSALVVCLISLELSFPVIPLCATCHTRPSTHTVLFNILSQQPYLRILVSSFYRGGNWVMGNLLDFPEVPKEMESGVRILVLSDTKVPIHHVIWRL